MILIRHGQSQFNVVYGATGQDPGIIDPSLTEEGVRQVEVAAEVLAERDIRHIRASPYARTLQTAEIIAARLDLNIEIEPLVRERSFFTCDIGTPRSELSERWPHLRFDHLTEIWWTAAEETESQMMKRCTAFHASLADFAEWQHLLVVSHWGFIKGLTGSALKNAEMVTVDLTSGQVRAGPGAGVVSLSDP